jgi:hypothetical protein
LVSQRAIPYRPRPGGPPDNFARTKQPLRPAQDEAWCRQLEILQPIDDGEQKPLVVGPPTGTDGDRTRELIVQRLIGHGAHRRGDNEILPR